MQNSKSMEIVSIRLFNSLPHPVSLRFTYCARYSWFNRIKRLSLSLPVVGTDIAASGTEKDVRHFRDRKSQFEKEMMMAPKKMT